MKQIVIEVCVESLESARLAINAGCHRLELCSQLALGGITPSTDLVRLALLATREVVVLIRQRSGDFYYDSVEKSAMIRSARYCAERHVTGLAVGALRNDYWDMQFMQQIARYHDQLDLVAHRAIDELLGPQPASVARIAEIVRPLIDLGFRRILTSGGYPDALQGAENIRKMIEYVDNRIDILPGGGVTPENACAILAATGAQQLHGSFQQLPRNLVQVKLDGQRLANCLANVRQMSHLFQERK